MKLIRAEEHLWTLRAEFRSYIESHPYEIIREVNGDPPVSVTLKLRRWTSPTLRWSVMVGDVIHNLRSSLDHLAWQLVKANGGHPGRGTRFPIIEDRIMRNPDRTEIVRNVTIAGGIAEDATTLLDALQPYQRVDDPTLHPLWILNHLSNIDKHRQLHFMMPWVLMAESTLPPNHLETLLGPQLHPGPFGDGSVIGTWPYPVGMNVDLQLAPLVSLPIEWPDDPSGQAIDLLAYLLDFVSENVVGAFESTCF